MSSPGPVLYPAVSAVGTNLPYGTERTSAIIDPPPNVTGIDTDIVVVLIYADDPVTITPPTGFAEAPNSPVVNATAGEPFSMHVYWSRRPSADENPYVFNHAATGNCGIAIRLTGCLAAGNPFLDTESSASTVQVDTSPPVSVHPEQVNTLLLWAGINYGGLPFAPALVYGVTNGYEVGVNTPDGLGFQFNTQSYIGVSGATSAAFAGDDACSAWLAAVAPAVLVGPTPGGPSDDPQDADDTTTTNLVGFMLFEVAQALSGLGGEYEVQQPRITVASTLLGKISAELASDPEQAKLDMESLLLQLNNLEVDLDSSPLADAISAVETLLGTWPGDDYYNI